MIINQFRGKITTDFIRLREKMYGYRKLDYIVAPQEHKKLQDKRCNGAKKCVVTENLAFDGYKTCLFEG